MFSGHEIFKFDPVRIFSFYQLVKMEPVCKSAQKLSTSEAFQNKTEPEAKSEGKTLKLERSRPHLTFQGLSDIFISTLFPHQHIHFSGEGKMSTKLIRARQKMANYIVLPKRSDGHNIRTTFPKIKYHKIERMTRSFISIGLTGDAISAEHGTT